jgi:GLPGLI family protein
MKTKIIFTVIALNLFINILQAQYFTAEYDVQRTLTFKISETESKSIQLDYIGYFYKANNKYISFLKPQYLDIYPEGAIEIAPNYFASIYSDTLQGISYADLDSNIARRRTEITGKGITGFNRTRTVVPGGMHWKVMPEKRVIDGLNCQRALLEFNGKTNYCEVWFCSDINVQVSLCNLMDLPGLLVEANYFSIQETYKLKSYKLVDYLPTSIFWPNEFNHPFEDNVKAKNN